MDFARRHLADARRVSLGQDPHAVPPAAGVVLPTCSIVNIFGVLIPELFVTSFDGPSAEAYYAWNEMEGYERAKWIEMEPAEWPESPPWPCHRSIWDFYGLRRRPKRP